MIVEWIFVLWVLQWEPFVEVAGCTFLFSLNVNFRGATSWHRHTGQTKSLNNIVIDTM